MQMLKISGNAADHLRESGRWRAMRTSFGNCTKPGEASIWRQPSGWIRGEKMWKPWRPKLRPACKMWLPRRNNVKVRSATAMWSLSLLLLAVSATGNAKQSGKTVDSGSFGIYVNGQRVATERFSIQQTSAGSTVDSQLQEEGANQKAAQNSTMQLTAQGELLRYEWHEVIPEKLDLELLPNDQFLIERIMMKPGEKPIEQPILLPSSTVVLDNNFFVHPELLAWRYLAQSCKQEAGNLKWFSAPTTFGVIVPQGRSSMR